MPPVWHYVRFTPMFISDHLPLVVKGCSGVD
jgi:hypothetical protein